MNKFQVSVGLQLHLFIKLYSTTPLFAEMWRNSEEQSVSLNIKEIQSSSK